MKKILMIFLILLLITLFSTSAIFAEEIKVRAYVNDTQLTLGQSTTFTIEITGDINVKRPDFSIPDCKIQYYGPGTQISVVNGKREEVIRYLYSLVPLKTGVIEMPSIKIKWKGKIYSTEPFKITVVEEGEDSGQSLEAQIKDYVFLKIEIPKTKAYVNEEIPLTITLFYHQNIDLRNIHYPEFETEHFIKGNFLEPERDVKVINGVFYNTINFKTTLQPISRGKYSMGPISLKADLVVPRKNSANSFFDSFFEPEYDLIPVKPILDEVNIEVLDFPAEKPENFTGAIGRFSLEVSVTPENAKVGEPITIRSRIYGEGNLKTVTAPHIEKTTDFKYYQPSEVNSSSIQQQGTKQKEKFFEQIIIPLKQADTIPTISFSYFDPEEEKYHTITKKDVKVNIQKENVNSQILNYGSLSPIEKVEGRDILYIKGKPDNFRKRTEIVSVKLILYNGILAIILLTAFLIKWFLHREHPMLKRRREIIKTTHKMLIEGENLLKQGENSSFYSLLYQTIQNYLKEMYGITITGISDYEIDYLTGAGLSTELIKKLTDFFQIINEKRFAGYSGTKGEMEKLLVLVKDIVNG